MSYNRWLKSVSNRLEIIENYRKQGLGRDATFEALTEKEKLKFSSEKVFDRFWEEGCKTTLKNS